MLAHENLGYTGCELAQHPSIGRGVVPYPMQREGGLWSALLQGALTWPCRYDMSDVEARGRAISKVVNFQTTIFVPLSENMHNVATTQPSRYAANAMRIGTVMT